MLSLQLLKKYLGIYLILVVLFVLLLIAVCLIPSDRIRANIDRSQQILLREGDYPLLGRVHKDSQLDNYTDSTILDIIYYIDSSKPLSSALANSYYEYNASSTTNIRTNSLKLLIDNNIPPNKQYPRYWNGYIVYFRPLLLFATYVDIRLINEILLSLLLSLLLFLIYKKLSLIVTIIFASSLAMINIWIIPFSMSFSSVIVITFISMIFLLKYPNLKIEHIGLLFFGIGACTSYVDLLTTPFLTFGYPALILLLLRQKNKLAGSIKTEFSFIFLIGASWIAGYSLLWFSKWVLASLVLHENIIANAVHVALSRLGGVIPEWLNDGKPLAYHALKDNLSLFIMKPLLLKYVIFYLIPVIFITFFILWHKDFNQLQTTFMLVLLSLLPFLWFAIASNHSAIHYWFTYRIQAVTFMAILCAMHNAINWSEFSIDKNNYLTKIKLRQKN